MVANPQLGLVVRIFPGLTWDTYRTDESGTDITSFVRLEEGISLSRGATDETSFPSAGRLSLTLNNRDYRFTPDNTSSSLFPNFKNRIPIRVERTISTFAISAITKVGTAEILTVLAGHGVLVGQFVTVTGAAANNNGTFIVTSTGATSVYLYNPSASTQASVSATGVATQSVWTGFVETIEERWTGGLQATVAITASDVLAQYARQKLPSSITGAQSAALVLYPLNDDTGSTSSADASGNGRASLRRKSFNITASPTDQTQTFDVGAFGSDPDENVLQLFRHSSNIGYYMVANLGLPSTDTGTVEGFFYLSNGPQSGSLFRIESGANAYAVQGTSPAQFFIEDLSTGTPTVRITGTTSVDDYEWHHYALTWSNVGSTTTWTLYVDGVSQGTYAETIASGPAVVQFFVGGADVTGSLMTCWAANVAIYDYDIGSAIQSNAKAINGYVETTGSRFDRVMFLADAYYFTDAAGLGDVTMGPQPTSGQDLLDVLKQINDCEDGAIYLSSENVLTYVTRSDRDTLGTVVSIDPKYLNTGTTLMRAPASVNSVTASRPSGGSVTASDSVSVAENGVASETVSLYVVNDQDLQRVAKRRLYRRSTQQSRIGNVEVNLATSPAINDALLAADVGTYLSVGPFPRGNVDKLLVRVEGLSDNITPSSWIRTFVTSPAGVSKSGSNWILGTSILDFTTTLA